MPFLGHIPLYEPVRAGRRRRRADRDQRPAVAAGAGHHGGRRARGAAGLDRLVLAARHSAAGRCRPRAASAARDPGTMLTVPFTTDHTGQRPRRDRPRGPPRAARRGQRLVPRRIEERAARASPGLAHLFEHLMFEGSAHQPGGYFAPLQEAGAAAQRLDEHRSHELLGTGADATRPRWRSGWRPTGWAGCCPR